MIKMLRHYVEFLYPDGGLEKEVFSRKLETLDIPEDCFGFRFFDRHETKEDGEILKGKPRDYSNTYYFGEIKTLDDIKRERPNYRHLILNMELHGCDVVYTRWGTYEPLMLGDIVLSEK